MKFHTHKRNTLQGQCIAGAVFIFLEFNFYLEIKGIRFLEFGLLGEANELKTHLM